MNASRLLVLAIALSPAVLLGQKREELVSIQRDVAQLEDQMKQMQKSLDEKFAALTALMQQAVETSNKNAATLATMQRDVDQKLAEQQTKLVAPVATLGQKVEDMSGEFGAGRENVDTMGRKFNELDTKVTDISSAVRQIAAQQPATAVLPTGGTAPGGTTSQAPEGPPPGMSADIAYQTAYGDYMGKKDQLALDEFAKFLQYFPTSGNAPNAWFYMGQIYFRNDDWENAAKTFDAVLEKYPTNAKTPEAQYMKACSLMSARKKTAASQEFKTFIENYPQNPRVKDAHKHLQEMGLEHAPGARRPK